MTKSFEIRRPGKGHALYLNVEKDGPRGPSLVIHNQGDAAVTVVALDVPIGDGSKNADGSPRTLRAALLEKLLQGCSMTPGSPPSARARLSKGRTPALATPTAPAGVPTIRLILEGASPAPVGPRAMRFLYDNDGNVIGAEDKPAR
jgi:hypothetical protein